MKNLNDVLAAAGLSRVFQHMVDNDFALVSASKTGMDNNKRTRDLKVMLKDMGLGFIPALGCWEGATEDSFLVPFMNKDQALEVLRAFDQDAVIWGTGGQYWFFKRDGSEGGPFDARKSFHHAGEEGVDGDRTEIGGESIQLKNVPRESCFKLLGGGLTFAANFSAGAPGGLRLGGKSKNAFTLSKDVDTQRDGQPFFFWVGNFAFASVIRCMGFNVHDLVPGPKLPVSSGSYDVRALAVYLPLERIESISSKWKHRRGESAMKTKNPIIADIWASLISKPGLGKRTGSETIIDKAWIDGDGKLLHHGAAVTHQEFAIRYLRESNDPAAETPEGRSLMKVDDIVLKRGWIRVQIYANEGMGLQGSPEAIRANGHVALKLLPKPKRVYIMEWPSGDTSLYTADQLSEIGLVEAK